MADTAEGAESVSAPEITGFGATFGSSFTPFLALGAPLAATEGFKDAAEEAEDILAAEVVVMGSTVLFALVLDLGCNLCGFKRS